MKDKIILTTLPIIEYAPGVFVPENKEYISVVEDILNNEKFQSMQQYIQHGTTNCLEHCIAVSYRSYLYARNKNLNYCAAARGGILHDMFLYDWHTRKQLTNEKWHGFKHPQKALEIAGELFDLTAKEKDIIKKHMWPLTISVPRYKETYIVLYYDKIFSTKETIKK